MISSLFWIVPISALTALLFAWIFYKGMMKQEEGTDKMKEIAAYVREGAMAYLKSQYTVVTKVFIILAVLLAILAYMGVQNPICSGCFPYRRFLFRALRLSWNENCNICIEQNCMGCFKILRQRFKDCSQERCRYGPCCCWIWITGYCLLVPLAYQSYFYPGTYGNRTPMAGSYICSAGN